MVSGWSGGLGAKRRLASDCSVGAQWVVQVVSGVLAVGGQWVVRRARAQEDEAVFKTMLFYR